MSTMRQQSGVRQRRWSKREYYRLGELNFFRGQRVELIEGRIMVMSPQGPTHSYVVDRMTKILQKTFGSGYWARMQLPLDLGQTTEPEPDVSVVIGESELFIQAHPTSAVLIVEVSETTLRYDRRFKNGLYARAGIADYWIVNLRRRHLEVYRDPIADVAHPFGQRYSNRVVLLPPATVSPLALPTSTIRVGELLPPDLAP